MRAQKSYIACLIKKKSSSIKKTSFGKRNEHKNFSHGFGKRINTLLYYLVIKFY